MNNPYNNIQPGNHQYLQYGYRQPFPIPPYPTTIPYAMPTPIIPPTPIPAPGTPGQSYAYYSPQHAPRQENLRYSLSNSPMHPNIPYNQTRMASPSPFIIYAPQAMPHYNFNTTNMISRPTRPVTINPPQINQTHSYPPTVANVTNNSNNTQNIVKPVETTESQEVASYSRPEFLRKNSEISNAVSTFLLHTIKQKTIISRIFFQLFSIHCFNLLSFWFQSNESNDTVGNLPSSQNLIDFGK